MTHGPTRRSTERQKDKSNDDGAGSFPNVTNLLYSVGSTGNAGADLGLPAIPGMAPVDVGDDTANFVSTVRGIGFAMSVDIAEIANTVDGAPVTVLDVVAVTDRDGGALKKISDFAENWRTYPTRTTSSRRRATCATYWTTPSTTFEYWATKAPTRRNAPAPPPDRSA